MQNCPSNLFAVDKSMSERTIPENRTLHNLKKKICFNPVKDKYTGYKYTGQIYSQKITFIFKNYSSWIKENKVIISIFLVETEQIA